MEEAGISDVTAGGDPTRVIRDGEGLSWTVREYVRRKEGQVDRSLLFDCGMAIRRVRDFPEAWYELDDDELLEVSRRR